MDIDLQLRHIEIERSNSDLGLAILVFKPGYSIELVTQLKAYSSGKNITILREKEVLLSRDAVIALYPKIFTYSREDLDFGLSWKKQTIDYLTSATSKCFLLEGEGIYAKLSEYKYDLREKHGKITHPKTTLSKEDFLEKVVENLVHVIDRHELQNGLWVLFGD